MWGPKKRWWMDKKCTFHSFGFQSTKILCQTLPPAPETRAVWTRHHGPGSRRSKTGGKGYKRTKFQGLAFSSYNSNLYCMVSNRGDRRSNSQSGKRNLGIPVTQSIFPQQTRIKCVCIFFRFKKHCNAKNNNMNHWKPFYDPLRLPTLLSHLSSFQATFCVQTAPQFSTPSPFGSPGYHGWKADSAKRSLASDKAENTPSSGWSHHPLQKDMDLRKRQGTFLF